MTDRCPHGVSLRSGCYGCHPEHRERDEAARREWERRSDLSSGIVEADRIAQQTGMRLSIERTPSGSWYVVLGHSADGDCVVDYQHSSLSEAVLEVGKRAGIPRQEARDGR